MSGPETLTLEDLAREVARLVDERGLRGAQTDGRVSEVPDGRTIRYYATLGLVDRPRVEGRQARYGRRHLLQLLAIKALQGRSLPLAEIQARLYARTDKELESLVESLGAPPTWHPPPRAVVWREVPVEPGLKVMVEESWVPPADTSALVRRIGAAFEALREPRKGADSDNGGTTS